MIKPTRRRLILSGMVASSALAMPSVLRAQSAIEEEPEGANRNIAAFTSRDWQDHFENLNVATILADTQSRVLHYWNAGGSDYRVYPTSVPRSDELTKRGYTTVVRKKVGPDWTPTASMVARFPEWKYMPPGPENPLGTHAMYLGWPAYLIHGTHDTRKIGRRSSDGCIGLYNEKIEELFAITPVGSQVKVI